MSLKQDELLPVWRLCLLLRGNKLGKINFGQKLEGVVRAQSYYDRVIHELERLNGQGSMARAVDTGITVIVILMPFKRSARTVVRRGERRTILTNCRCHAVLQGMGTFMHTIDGDSQHDHKEKPGNEFEGEVFSHKYRRDDG